MAVAGAVNQALYDYNSRISRFIKQQGPEYNRMFSMLAATVAGLSAGSDDTTGRLQKLHRDLERAADIHDIRDVRAQLSTCLEDLKHETTRQKEQSLSTVAELQSELQQSQNRLKTVRAPCDVNRPIRLPAREAAEADLHELLNKPDNAYAALFVVERVKIASQQFGDSVAENLVQSFLQDLTARMTPVDRVYRWSFGSVLVLMQRQDHISAVRAQISRAISTIKNEKTFQVGKRTVSMPVSAVWNVIHLAGLSSLTQVVSRLDKFLPSDPC